MKWPQKMVIIRSDSRPSSKRPFRQIPPFLIPFLTSSNASTHFQYLSVQSLFWANSGPSKVFIVPSRIQDQSSAKSLIVSTFIKPFLHLVTLKEAWVGLLTPFLLEPCQMVTPKCHWAWRLDYGSSFFSLPIPKHFFSPLLPNAHLL